MDQFWSELQNPWVIFGLGAQALFFMRFFIQWLASERAGRSVIPVSFWWLSIAGASGLLIYAVQRQDPVFILGQSFGFAIYARNLWLIYRERRGIQLDRSLGASQTTDSASQPAKGNALE